MPQQLKQQNEEKQGTEEGISLKGTFTAVMLLGAFIIVSWVGVWALFLSR
ncbi:cytochrome c oxidase subunit 2A [Lentibacillus lipolyticus]|nr:cytochrome c oxidase subunit 2A [Lentibacillus lipolyticus]